MSTEIHTMKPFRNTDLGIIRLNKLAYSDNMKISVDGKEIFPIGFDTYGHPIISAGNFKYYKALKSNANRENRTFLLEVEYKSKPFCIKKKCFDDIDSIKEAIFIQDEKKDECISLKRLKKILVYRKQFVFDASETANSCNQLNKFVLYNRYVLDSDGHVYYLENPALENDAEYDDVIQIDESNSGKFTWKVETHIPNENDTCLICGKKFTLIDLKKGHVTEDNEKNKAHTECYIDYEIAVELQMASGIIDAVYENVPPVTLKSEWDHEKKCNRNWYVFETVQGTVSISFNSNIIVIKWEDDFKPFNMNIFGCEAVTKNERYIHAWSKEFAIGYLFRAKNA